MKTQTSERRKARRFRTAALQTAMAWLLVLAAAWPLAATEDFRQVTGACDLAFPEDHGPHPAFRTEWWYYTGQLTGADQRRFGFQLTFFRSGLAPPAARRQWPQPASPWRTDQLYLAHAAVTDIAGGRHLQAEKMARPNLSMAGAEKSGHGWRIFLHDWQAEIQPDGHQLTADGDTFAFNLALTPVKPIVLHGDQGYSRKGRAPERASCYYSFTRMEIEGTVSIDQVRHQVRGSGWMDHEFSTAPLEPGVTGWDWFSLQLDDQTEVMVYLLRQVDGTLNPASSGTYVLPSGQARHLTSDDIRIAPLKHWTSPHSKGRYPIQWRVSIASLALDLTVGALVDDQEMRTPGSTDIEYWEGSVDVRGTRAGKKIGGRGYVEMTGYAKPFDTAM